MAKVTKEGISHALNKIEFIEYDDSRNFEAYEDGYFAHNHICVNLFQIVIE